VDPAGESQPTVAGSAPAEHGSPLVRALFFGVGAIAFIAGVLGIFLPLLPATPLFILAAACFARAYRPFHEWMLAHRVIGPMLREWHHHRSIPHRTKMIAIGTMLASFGTSIWFVVKPAWLQAVLALFALGLAVWMYRIPSRDRPGRHPH
jgi:uncharacterized membrane protein YbaN (DUF454 family)